MYGSAHTKNTIAVKTVGGVGIVEVCGKLHTLTAGSLLIFRYEDMSYYKPKKDEWNFYWFEFDGGTQMLPHGTVVDAELSPEDIPMMDHCFSSLSLPSEAAYISALFSAMLLRWLRGYERYHTAGKELISASVDYIINNLSEPLNVAALAGKCHIGERTYRELFKRYMGSSPQEYITDIRIRNAEELLLTTSLSVKEIALSLGFANQYYFANFFKKHTDCYPSSFRKNAKPVKNGNSDIEAVDKRRES
jgi:AraC-like DNA-binding protein